MNPGHGEFYVGGGGKEDKNKYNVTYVNSNADTNNEKKKSGISSIEVPISFISPNSLKAEGTFAWGSVKDEFPVESSTGQKHYFYYDSIANVFRHCECGREIDVAHSTSCALSPSNENYGRQYTVIWRKK